MLEYFALALISSALLSAGLMMMKTRAAHLPHAHGLRIASAVLAWICDPIWISGLAVQTFGFALYILTVAHLPISLVSVLTQGGIGLFVLLCVVFLHERASAIEWTGIAAMGVAMVLLGFSMSAGAASGAIESARVAWMTLLLSSIGAIPYLSRAMRGSGIAAAIASGFAFGLASLYAKAMTDTVGGGSVLGVVEAAATNLYVWAVIVSNIVGLVLLQNSFFAARGIIAMPLSSALSNVVPIAGGMIALGERLPDQPAAAVMRIGSFALTIAGSAMLSRATAEHRVVE